MKKVLFTVLVMIISIVANAQMEDRRGYIGVTLGPAIPLGDFGDTNLDNEDAGLAKTGINFNLVHFGYKFSQNFGIAASWFGAAHEVDISGIDEVEFSANEIDAGTWSYGGLFAGVLVSIPAGEKLFFEFKPMVGFVTATSPEIKVSGSTYMEDQQGSSIGFDLLGSVRYNFAEKWCAMFNVDYLTAKPEFDYFEQSISALSFNIGIAFRLK
jgi:hypothetical protein